jgi:hypothetical protein
MRVMVENPLDAKTVGQSYGAQHAGRSRIASPLVMHPSTFKNYKKKPIEPETTPPTPEEKAGVFEQKPHKGIGDILKETQP